MLDFPASGQALWSLADQGGPRPEYLLPVLYYESGFDPSVPNAAGYPYYGLNQISADFLAARGISPSDYLGWSASAQLSQVVTPYFLDAVSRYGPLQSGTRTYQAEFLPATLATARGLSDVLTAAPAAAYEANKIFDRTGSGAIRVSDLATAVRTMASKPAVQNAIGQTFALRPGERPKEPVYGDDFGWWSRLPTGEKFLLVGSLGTLLWAGVLVRTRGI